MAANSARVSFESHRLVTGGLCLSGMAIAGLIHAVFLLLLGVGLSPISVRGVVLELFFFLFVLLFAGALPFVAGAMLHASDSSLLGATPIPRATVVAAKTLEAVASNSIQFLVIGLPAVLACSISLEMGVLGFLLLLPLLSAFCLLPVLATVLLLLLAIKVYGQHRTRLALGTVTTLVGLAVCLLVVAQTSGVRLSPNPGDGWAGLAVRPTLAASHGPSAAFAGAFLDLAGARYPEALATIGALCACVAALFGLCILLGAKVLGSDVQLDDGDGLTGRLLTDVAPARRGLLRALPVGVAAVVAKDLRCIARDGLLISQLCMPMLLFLVPFILALRGGANAVGAAADIFPFAAGITGVILFMQTSIVSLTSVGMESRAFWLLRASPNRCLALLKTKFLVSAAISSAIGIALTLVAAVAFGGRPLDTLVAAMGVGMAAAGLCGIGVGVAALLPKFSHDNPSLRVSPWALVLSFFGSVLYVGVALAILATGLILASLRPDWAFAIHAVSWATLALVTSICVACPISAGAARLESYQWEH